MTKGLPNSKGKSCQPKILHVAKVSIECGQNKNNTIQARSLKSQNKNNKSRKKRAQNAENQGLQHLKKKEEKRIP